MWTLKVNDKIFMDSLMLKAHEKEITVEEFITTGTFTVMENAEQNQIVLRQPLNQPDPICQLIYKTFCL